MIIGNFRMTCADSHVPCLRQLACCRAENFKIGSLNNFKTADVQFCINFHPHPPHNFWQGHHCPEGSPLALPCPTGEYQPNPGSPSCIPCRPGFYCEEAIVGEPRPCPPHSFCPAGTAVRGIGDVIMRWVTFHIAQNHLIQYLSQHKYVCSVNAHLSEYK